MNWRLGLDLGTNSLGWWAFRIEKENPNNEKSQWKITESLGGGVYIFPDGREPSKGGRIGDGNAVQRRLARGMRRNRDRRRTRLRAYMRELMRLGLMPDSEQERDKLFQTPRAKSADGQASNAVIIDGEAVQYNPYYLRAQALERKLEPYELGRALYHLGIRRGFKSNRIAQNSDEDGGKLKERIEQLEAKLEGQTLGQFLWQHYEKEGRHQPNGIRFRGEDDFYSNREMYAVEFDAIKEEQAPHYPHIKEDDWNELREYVLFQHPLRPVERGYCKFFTDQHRHWNDTPIGHDFRVYQEVNNLRWIDEDQKEHPLSCEQRDIVLELLHTRKSDVKFESIRKYKRSLYFPDCIRFNLEDEKRKALKNHSIGAQLNEDPVLGPLWETRCSNASDDGKLDDIFEAIQEENDDDELRERLFSEFNLDEQTVKALLRFHPSRATANVSRKFMEEIVPIMRDQGLPYTEAVTEMSDESGNQLHHSQIGGYENTQETLPYYGKVFSEKLLGADPNKDPDKEPEKHFGKINNPTVHVALNSLRRVVNALINRFEESPTEVHVELTRDLKLPRSLSDEINRKQATRQRENQQIRERLQQHDIANPSARDVQKVRLWEELAKDELLRRCPFTGETISFSKLMSDEVEVEHLLPFKRTLDDSISNKTVAMRRANRIKGNKTPYEAFASDAHADEGIEWAEIRGRADRLPANKAWRFGPDAMQKFEKDNAFIARQLTDNAYIARIAQSYLGCLEGVKQVVPNRGGLTALLRGKWKLHRILSDDSSKNRNDHRHHALDAAVIGLTGRSVLQSVSAQSARDIETLRIQVPDLPIDIETLRSQIGDITVAFKPDHGLEGRIYQETAYGFVAENSIDPELPDYNLVTRKPLTSLSSKEFGQIRDVTIRRDIQRLIPNPKEVSDPEKKRLLTQYSEKTGVRKVRILIANQTVKKIGSAKYKGYAPDSFLCCDIWRCPKGKVGNWKSDEYKWEGVFWPYPNSPGAPDHNREKPHPAAKFVCRLFKDDMITYKSNGKVHIARVAGFSTTNNRLDVVPHLDATKSQNYVGINPLGQMGLRKIHVTPDGRVRGLK